MTQSPALATDPLHHEVQRQHEEKTSTDSIDRSIPEVNDDECHANPENGPDGECSASISEKFAGGRTSRLGDAEERDDQPRRRGSNRLHAGYSLDQRLWGSSATSTAASSGE